VGLATWSDFVGNTAQVWQAYLLAQRMRARPSEVFNITGAFRQYCFDRAVITFGAALEAELDGVEGRNAKAIQGKKTRLLSKWLDEPVRFRDPAGSQAVQQSAGPTTGANPDVVQQVSFSGDGSGM
jgi:hypothetical protein